MTQKFYLHAADATTKPTAGEKSTVQPASTLGANNASGTQEDNLMNGTIGVSQTSQAFNSDGTTSARSNYMGRWSSVPIQAGTYGSGTWTIDAAYFESSPHANSFLNVSVYFWNPSGSVRGFVYDSGTDLGSEWNQTSETNQSITFTGANVTASEGDILVIEVWRHATQAMTGAYSQVFYFDGTTEGSSTDVASFLNAPADIPIVAPAGFAHSQGCVIG